MADDSSANGHSTDARYADLDDEFRGLERQVRLLAAEQCSMRMSLDLMRDQLKTEIGSVADLLRKVVSQNNEILNSRDGYSVLKRLAAVEEAVKPRRVARGKR